MKAGILREKIELWKPVVTRTEFGSQRTSFEFHKAIRASVRSNSGYTSESGYEVFHSTSKTFIVRHYQDVVENMRIKYEGKFYSIDSITPNKYYNDKEITTNLVNE